MKRRIDFGRVLSDPLHGVRIALYVLLLAIILPPLQGVILQSVGWGRFAGGVPSRFSLAQPATLAGGVEVQEAIHHFNGQSSRGVWTGQITFVLISLILSYVLGPALLAWGLRARARLRQTPFGNPSVTTIALALTLGGVSLLSTIPAPMYAVVSNATFETMAHDCQLSAIQDDMSDDLFLMARRAQVVFFLPVEMGGGNQSWLARDGSGNPVIDISKILVPTHSGDGAQDHSVSRNENKYSLHVERADSLTISGVGTESEWQEADGVAVDGQPEKVHICIGVTPDRLNMVFINQ